MESGKVQTRDKEGNIISTYDTRKKSALSTMTTHQNMYVTSTGVQFAGINDLRPTDEYKEQLNQQFGKEFMDLNYSYNSLAYDEKTQTTYVGSRNLVFVANSQGIKGVMYFPDKSIMGLDIDPITDSLMISASNWPEADKCISFDKGGSLEILPTDMVDKRIQESMEYLKARQKRERMKKVTTAESYIKQDRRMLSDKKSPLQKREDELSRLEHEAENIKEAERLIDKQSKKNIQVGE